MSCRVDFYDKFCHNFWHPLSYPLQNSELLSNDDSFLAHFCREGIIDHTKYSWALPSISNSRMDIAKEVMNSIFR